MLPLKYKDFADVFGKMNTHTLPLYHSYDCPINLQPRAEVPFGCIYFLLELELQALHNYLQENLQRGLSILPCLWLGLQFSL